MNTFEERGRTASEVADFLQYKQSLMEDVEKNMRWHIKCLADFYFKSAPPLVLKVSSIDKEVMSDMKLIDESAPVCLPIRRYGRCLSR